MEEALRITAHIKKQQASPMTALAATIHRRACRDLAITDVASRGQWYPKKSAPVHRFTKNETLELPRCPVPTLVTTSQLDCPSGPPCREDIPKRTPEQSWIHLALCQQLPASCSAQWPATWCSAGTGKQRLIKKSHECERGDAKAWKAEGVK